MSYSEKKLFRHTLDSFDFGGGADEVMSFRLPKTDEGVAMQGQLVNIGVMITEAFQADTVNTVELGTAADNDAYALLTIANAAADEDCYDVSDDADAILNESIPAGTLLEVNLTAGTGTSGGAVTGTGRPFFDFWVW